MTDHTNQYRQPENQPVSTQHSKNRTHPLRSLRNKSNTHPGSLQTSGNHTLSTITANLKSHPSRRFNLRHVSKAHRPITNFINTQMRHLSTLPRTQTIITRIRITRLIHSRMLRHRKQHRRRHRVRHRTTISQRQTPRHTRQRRPRTKRHTPRNKLRPTRSTRRLTLRLHNSRIIRHPRHSTIQINVPRIRTSNRHTQLSTSTQRRLLLPTRRVPITTPYRHIKRTQRQKHNTRTLTLTLTRPVVSPINITPRRTISHNQKHTIKNQRTQAVSVRNRTRITHTQVHTHRRPRTTTT